MSLETRRTVKRALGSLGSRKVAPGVTMLVYHRVDGGTSDERDLSRDSFTRQLDVLAESGLVCSIDEAADALEAGDQSPRVVITFDDGFADVHDPAYPLLVDRSLPFTVYLATAYVDGQMHWDGSTAKEGGPGLTLGQVEELARSPLCTLGNHTHGHTRPELLTPADLDACTDWLLAHVGVRPQHFAYPWGIAVPEMENELRARFRTATTCEVGRNLPGANPMRLARVPVRNSDPIEFFKAKLTGSLIPERVYGTAVSTAKRLGARA